MASIILSDGRSLAFAEYGDPLGKPIFFFHGMPGSRYFHPPDEITTRVCVRLICVERPGYGESTFQPGRRILDWPRDIVQLADFLGIQKFAVAGHSGGGPYALACSVSLPDRVTSASIISGVGPIQTLGTKSGKSTANGFGLAVGRFIPWLLWRALIWVFYHRRAADPAADIDRGLGIRPQADEEQISIPEVREVCVQSEVEAFRPGLCGMAWDAHLLTRPWGFHLEDINLPAYLWHGSADSQVPISMARHLAGKIHNSQITICKDEAHLLLFNHWEEILAQITSE
jgi:pimeloyl-ACP methyl ester carboxylesterase